MSKFAATQARSTSGILRSLRSRIVSVGDWMMKAQSSQMGTDWRTGVTVRPWPSSNGSRSSIVITRFGSSRRSVSTSDVWR